MCIGYVLQGEQLQKKVKIRIRSLQNYGIYDTCTYSQSSKELNVPQTNKNSYCNDISVTCHFRVPPSMSNVSEAIMSNSKYIVTCIDRAGGI